MDGLYENFATICILIVLGKLKSEVDTEITRVEESNPVIGPPI